MKKNTKVFVLALTALTTAVGLSSCTGDVYNSDKEYTYYTYLSTKPSTWNTHDWETSDESYVTSFTEMGFYDVVLDSSKSNYEFVTEMASEFPKKISSADLTNEYDEYSTKYFNNQNIPDNQIFDIKLNTKATWEDGTPIKAQDYVDSLELQLSPKYVNFRADSYYASNLVVANAERYYKSGRQTLEPLYNYVNGSSYEYTDDKYKDTAGSDYYINLQKVAPIAAEYYKDGKTITLAELFNQPLITGKTSTSEAARRITESVKYYLFKYGDADWKAKGDNHEDWAKAKSPADVKDAMTDFDISLSRYQSPKKLIKVRKNLGSNNNGGYNYSDWKNEAELVTYTMEDLVADINTILKDTFNKQIKKNSERLMLYGYIKNEEFNNFDNVGIKAIDDSTIRLILGKSIKMLDLKFSLTSNWLVKTDLYEQLSKKNGNKWSTDYASKKVGNYKAYGPYKLVKYEEGKSFVIEKNDKWYGYTDGKHEGQFQMTRVKTTIVEDHQTAVGMFEKGQLDDLTLDANDMKTYGNSKYSQTVYESYTQKISFNSNRNKLLGRQSSNINKVILANDDFRKGLSLSLNRNDFAAKTTAGSKAFTGLLNDLYLTDVQVGEMYTSTSQGEGVYNEVYGELGGNPYSDDYKVKALEKAAQGYNLQQATYFVEKAFKDEIEAGNLKLNDKIELEIQVYDNSSTTTINMTRFISDSFKTVIDNAVAKYNAKQTDDAKKANITFELKVVKNEDYYNAAKSGNYDMIFSVWGGAAINPYGLMQVYCDPDFESTCEYGFKGNQNSAKLEIAFDDGTSEERTIAEWYTKLNGDLAEMDIDELVSDRKSEVASDKELVAKYNAQHQKRVTVLAKLEAAILKRFEAIPLVARGSTSLYSVKVKYATNKYINLVGYGGIRFMTFNYTDKQWNEFIKSNEFSKDIYK